MGVAGTSEEKYETSSVDTLLIFHKPYIYFKRKKIDCFVNRILVYILIRVWPVHWVDGFWDFKCSIWVFILFNLSWVLAIIQPGLVSDSRFNPVLPPVISGFKNTGEEKSDMI